MALALIDRTVLTRRDDDDSPGAWLQAGRPFAFRKDDNVMLWLRNGVMALAAASVLFTGCAHASSDAQRAHDQDNGLLDAGVTQQRTVVYVRNNNWSDMTIYLVRAGSQQRLGSVPSQSSQSFVVPTHLIVSAGRVHLMADPIGSSKKFMSPALMLSPGQKAEWVLENMLSLSSMWVR